MTAPEIQEIKSWIKDYFEGTSLIAKVRNTHNSFIDAEIELQRLAELRAKFEDELDSWAAVMEEAAEPMNVLDALVGYDRVENLH